MGRFRDTEDKVDRGKIRVPRPFDECIADVVHTILLKILMFLWIGILQKRGVPAGPDVCV
jgi:hypothetical protein